jgi:serine/threonine protein kinase
MGESAVVDLVCGPASPLAETFQRYRLVARLGAGGQADVYRGVRLCGGVTSTAVTVKVFRINPKRTLADELRSWDKGDAALMDLNTRGVPGICRRVDGFYGPPPHITGKAPAGEDAVPYQVYDYLHGINLRDYVTSKAGFGATNRLSATASLLNLADSIKAMHEPDNVTLCPVLHMDVKPSNIMVLTNGDTRLIDFTGARYCRSAEITQIAYTPESGGPEALRGEVTPAYDVHGFGAVAFFLIAGVPPRGSGAPPMERHDVFTGRPALRDHLLAVLADRPQDRPSTYELTAWTQTLVRLVRASHVPDVGLDWSDRPSASQAAPRAVGRVRAALTGTETDAFVRIEALERELVALRAKVGARPAAALPGAVASPVASAFAASPVVAVSPASPAGPTSGSPRPPSAPPSSAAPTPSGSPRPTSIQPAPAAAMVGRAQVVARPLEPSGYAAPEGTFHGGSPEGGARVSRRPKVNLRTLRKGGGWTIAGASFAVLCWFVWAAANRKSGAVLAPGFLVATAVVALGLFVLLRLLGRLVIEGWMHKPRKGAHGAHLGTAAFLVAVGVTYLQETAWIMQAYRWAKGL